MREQVYLEESAGKTVQYVHAAGDQAWILFADGTFCYLQSKCDCGADWLEQPRFTLALTTRDQHAWMRQRGLVTAEDVTAALAADEKSFKEHLERIERLRAKFEAKGGF